MKNEFNRKVLFPLLFTLGLDKLILFFSKRSYKSIVYHGVIPFNGNYFSPRHIDAEQFEKQLKYLKENFEIITQTELFSRIENGIKPKKNTVALSFDDGFRNNLEFALPLLEKYEIPCTIFISSILLEEMDIRCLWSELVAVLEYSYKDQVIVSGDYQFINGFSKEHNISMANYIKQASYERRKDILNNLINDYKLKEKIHQIPEDLWKLMDKQEFNRLSNSKFIDIGAHSYSHYNLGLIDIEKAKLELSISKQMLEKELNQKIDILAYPDGNYTSELKNLASELGYKQQYAVDYKLKEDQSDLRILDRFGISSTTTFEANMLRLSISFFNAKSN